MQDPRLDLLSESLLASIMADPRPASKKLTVKGGIEWCPEFLLSLPAYEQLIGYLCGQFSANAGLFRDIVLETAGAVRSFLARSSQGSRETGVALHPDHFRQAMRALRRAVLSGEVEFTLCRRVIGIELSARAELSDSVTLVRLSEEELKERMPAPELAQFGLGGPDLSPLNKVEVRCRRREPLLRFASLFQGPAESRPYLRETERLQEALLLLTAEAQVDLGSSIFLVSDPPLGLCSGSAQSQHKSAFIYPPMVVPVSDLPELVRYFSIAQQVQEFPPLKSALHRYTLACLRNRAEDALVDLVIGLESVLLQGLQNELSHRFSLNGSSLCHWILGKPRKEGYALFHAAYTARSSVVHGYGRKLKASRLESLSNELRYLLARFLAWLVEEAPALGFRPHLESEDWLQVLFDSPPSR